MADTYKGEEGGYMYSGYASFGYEAGKGPLRHIYSRSGALPVILCGRKRTPKYKAKTSKSIATKKAMQNLAVFGASSHSAKFIMLNIKGSEENLNIADICELSDLIHTEFGNDKCNLIWGASIDNTIIDNIYVSLWLSF